MSDNKFLLSIDGEKFKEVISVSEHYLAGTRKIADELIRQNFAALSKEFDDLIFKVLEQHGYSFKNREEKMNFIETRCSLVRERVDPDFCYIYINYGTDQQQLILSFDITPKIKFEGNKATATMNYRVY